MEQPSDSYTPDLSRHDLGTAGGALRPQPPAGCGMQHAIGLAAGLLERRPLRAAL